MTNLLTRLLTPRTEKVRPLTLEAKNAKLMEETKKLKKLLDDMIDWCQVEQKNPRQELEARSVWFQRGMDVIDASNDLCDTMTESRP